jgi:TetR/AcrR family transcriptional repressor of uid operon
MPKLKPETLAERKQHILDAALICFALSGYHQTTMDDIVAEAGLSKGGVYVHFDSKKALFQALIAWAMDQFAFDLERIPSTDVTIVEQLKAVMRAMIESMSSQRFQEISPLFLEMWVQHLNDAEVKKTAVGSYAQFRGPLAQLIETGINQGSLRQVDALSMANILIAIPEGLMVQALVDKDSVDWRSISDTLDSFIDGLRLQQAKAL